MALSKPLSNWLQAGKWFEVRGERIFYREEGRGPALLCIHGFPTASWDWHRILPMLTPHFRVILPDLLGYGFSDKPNSPVYETTRQAERIEALLEACGIAEVHLLCHDYGDTVAQELLARRLEGRSTFVYQSICLLNGGLFPEVHRPRMIQRLLLSPVGFVIAKRLSEPLFAKRFSEVFAPDYVPNSDHLHCFWQLIEYNKGHRIAHRLIRYIPERSRNRERWVGALEGDANQLLFINGSLDPVSGRHMADRFRTLIPSGEVVDLSHVGHYPQFEDPDAVWKAYQRFMQRWITL